MVEVVGDELIALGLLAGERCAPISEAVGVLANKPYDHVFLVRVSRGDT